jgi:uroporphyrinogen-III synthase
MRAIVTRPRHDAERWVRALEARGIEALALPLIDIAPATDAAPLCAAWQRLRDYQALMFVSGNAVQHFHAARPQNVPPPQPLPRSWATGPGTLAALHQALVPADSIDAPDASAGQFDSEALWAIVGAGVHAGDRVLIVRGGEPGGAGAGRNWFATQLETAGAQADFVVAYERHPPRWTPTQQQQAEQAAGDGAVWLLSSSEAVGHLTQRVPGAMLVKARAVATHPRIAQAAREAGFGVVCESRPTLDDVIASIESLA